MSGERIEPNNTERARIRDLVNALVRRAGNQPKLASDVGLKTGMVARLATAKPGREGPFTVERDTLAKVAAYVDPNATVDDLLAGRLIGRVQALGSAA